MFRVSIATRILRICFCLLPIAFILPRTLLAAEDDLTSLQMQFEELKKENAALRQENIELRKELREMKKKSDATQPSGESSDNIVGKTWEIIATTSAGKRFGPFRFLAHEGNIYVQDLEKPRIGYYTEKGANVRVDITNAENPAANGVYTLIQIGKSRP